MTGLNRVALQWEGKKVDLYTRMTRMMGLEVRVQVRQGELCFAPKCAIGRESVEALLVRRHFRPVCVTKKKST